MSAIREEIAESVRRGVGKRSFTFAKNIAEVEKYETAAEEAALAAEEADEALKRAELGYVCGYTKKSAYREKVDAYVDALCGAKDAALVAYEARIALNT